MSNIPTEFRGVAAVAKANIYFDGKVVSHTIIIEVKQGICEYICSFLG